MKYINTHYIGLTLFVCVSALSLTACEKMAEKATEAAIEQVIESETGEEIDIQTNDDGEMTIQMEDGSIITTEDGETVTITNDEGEVTSMSGDNVAIPDNFPKDIPLPESFQAMSVMTGEADMFILGGEAKGSAEDIQSYVQAEFTKAGWKEVMTFSEDDETLLMMEKGERTVNYSISDFGNHTIGVNVAVLPTS